MLTTEVPKIARVRRRTIAVLIGTQVASGVGLATGITVASLVAAELSGSEIVAGAAQTSTVAGAALAALLLSRLADRRGRRPALATGYLVAAAGAVVAAVAVPLGSWPLLLCALVPFGFAAAAGLSARFAATDLAEPGRRARALAAVVWAVTVGAVAGPNLAEPVQRLAGTFGVAPGAGPFLLSGVMFGLAGFGAAAGLRPDPLLLARQRAAEEAAAVPPVAVPPVAVPPAAGEPALGELAPAVPDRPAEGVTTEPSAWQTLRAKPLALLAVTAIAVSHAAMVGLMSLTPVHMNHGGATLQLVGLVISLHVAGMYALSPVFGWLADRFGRMPVLAGGAALLALSGVVSASAGGTDAGVLTVGLIALGLGWSAALVGGSTLLTDAVEVGQRARVQGLSDVTMNVSGAVGGVLAGAIVAVGSYTALGFGVAVLALMLLARVALVARRPA